MGSGDSLPLFGEEGSGRQRSGGTAPDARPDPAVGPGAPLADRMRPRHLDEMVGQEALVGPGAPLRALLEAGSLPSLLLWGPPGSGKTTLARLVAASAPGPPVFLALSAVTAGVKEVRDAIVEARRARRIGRATVLFLDEIHRFNRAQQDALLPHVEAGTVTLVGATTENPSFEVIGPLLSRCRVFTLRPLGEADLVRVLERALADPERGLGKEGVAVGPEALRAVAAFADGDARRALGALETAVALQRAREPGAAVGPETLREALGRQTLLHDRDRDAHYDVASALIKSLRASDPDAALYYLARLLEAGDDPRFAARRLVIFASEDVGNAEPQALPLAMATFQAVERVGMPEARIPLAQATTFLACAPKSNAAYAALGRAEEAVRRHGAAPVPLHLRNAPTPLMKAHGHGRDYVYPHDREDAFVGARNLPESVEGEPFYRPTHRGAEGPLGERLAAWRRRRETGAGAPGETETEPPAARVERDADPDPSPS